MAPARERRAIRSTADERGGKSKETAAWLCHRGLRSDLAPGSSCSVASQSQRPWKTQNARAGFPGRSKRELAGGVASWVSRQPRRRVIGSTAHMEIVRSPCDYQHFASNRLGLRGSIAAIAFARLAKRCGCVRAGWPRIPAWQRGREARPGAAGLGHRWVCEMSLSPNRSSLDPSRAARLRRRGKLSPSSQDGYSFTLHQ